MQKSVSQVLCMKKICILRDQQHQIRITILLSKRIWIIHHLFRLRHQVKSQYLPKLYILYMSYCRLVLVRETLKIHTTFSSFIDSVFYNSQRKANILENYTGKGINSVIIGSMQNLCKSQRWDLQLHLIQVLGTSCIQHPLLVAENWQQVLKLSCGITESS